MKSPISILTWLCLLFLASCISNKKTSLEAFKQDVYTPCLLYTSDAADD